ncbi:MAG TPA: hypothetical protein VFW40_13665 [Capsulimonadaceae bacterium]|nr:hypothetical protein [Capsulimonadaceae bacterium]
MFFLSLARARHQVWLRWVAVIADVSLFLMSALFATKAFADQAQPTLPSVNAPAEVQLDVQATSVGAETKSLDDTYYWFDVPQNRQVEVERATFDTEGFKLIDKSNETILVPFPKNNPYVMQFAQTARHHMYFVNKGNGPIFYLPSDSYMSYAPKPDARWYPFTKDFHPVDPVYEGLAPTWGALISMTWYPQMIFKGGYWSSKPIGHGVSVAPTPGLLFNIDGHIYTDWAGFMSYSMVHPTKGR